MASYANGNVAKLQDAGLIAEGPLPDELQSVVDGLTGDEVDILMSIKRRLDAADIPDDFQLPTDRPKGRWELWMVF